jgi:hypothetical protein
LSSVSFADGFSGKSLFKVSVTISATSSYNRKIVHMLAGGVVALSVPFLFDSWVYPLAIGLALTIHGTASSPRQTYGFHANKGELE